MASELRVSVGQHSDRGRKEINQDFHGVCIPTGQQLSAKGIAIALADGISSSQVSHIASESAVRGFLHDYYCTSDAWSVKTSAQRVLAATNSWLFSQGQQSEYRFDRDRGYVCTLSAIVFKSSTAHLFHVGDARIYRLHDNALEQLTDDHRVRVSEEQSYLSRAIGADRDIEIDYRALQLEAGDTFLLSTDGVHEYVDSRFMINSIRDNAEYLDQAARCIVAEAQRAGSPDNLTVQIVRIDGLPRQQADEAYQRLSALPFPPVLQPRALLDGYRIVRELHASHRSHIYLAVDDASGDTVVVKTLATELQEDPGAVERFLLEEWVARRIDNAHVLKAWAPTRKREHLYVVMEYIEGRTLAQWMIDNPRRDLETVRGLVEQIANGLQAFHRLEMVHQDLRPANILIDNTGTVKIIDFGSAKVAGIMEGAPQAEPGSMLGTAQYAAPEYFIGADGSSRSDIFSLAVITYQLLTGKQPYGAQVAKARTRAAQAKLKYASVLDDEKEIPAWIDGVLRKALHPDPYKRYAELSEFTYDLRYPTQAYLDDTRPPLIERNPVMFWKSVSFALAFLLALSLFLQSAIR